MNRKILFVAVSLALTSATAQENTIRLEKITIEGNSLFDVEPSENSTDYTMEAATVGTKIPAALRDIPQSVSIVTQQFIKEHDVRTFDQLASKTPGLRVLANDDGRSSVFARGYEYDEYNIDGLPAQMQSINGTLPNLAAFDRVEVMRGPSGLFDSSGEMGGIVNFVRKRPTQAFSGHLSAGVGTLKQYHLGADISSPLNSDGSIRGRALIDINSKTPAISNKSNHSEVAYGAVDIDLTDSTVLGLGYLFQQRHLKPDNGLPTLGQDKRLPTLPTSTFYGAKWNAFSMQSHDVFADIKHDFGNGGLGQAGLRYADRDSDMNYVFSRSAQKNDGSFVGAGLGAKVAQQAFAFDASYTQPFETWGNISEYVVGADFNHFSTQTQRGRAMFKDLTANKINNLPYRDLLSNAQQKGKGFSDQTTTLNDLGLYGKLTLRPIQPLALIAGGRLSHWAINTEDAVKSTNLSRKENVHFTGYAGLVYDFDTNHSVYASYSSLFAPQTELNSKGEILPARQGQQYEAGIKGSYYGDRLQTRLTLFKLDDKHAATPVVNERYHTDIGQRNVKGIEAEINGEITPQWSISAGYTYIKTDVEQKGDRQEGFFLLMPQHSANLWTSYHVNDQWTIGGGLNSISGFESAQGLKANAYTTVDAMAAYNVNDKLHLQFNVNNLLNSNYYKRVGSAGTFNMPGEERTFGASLRYEF